MNLERRPDDLPERGESDKVLARLGVMYSGVVTIACLGALSFYGSGGAIGAIGGGAVDGAGPTAGGTAPDAPTVSAVATTDTSFYLLGSTYSGDGTHSGSLYVVDTVGGDWSTSDTLGLQAGPDSLTRTDTIFNGDLNNIALATAGSAVLIGRAQYTNEFGTSAFGATDTFTVAVGVANGAITHSVDWATATGITDNAVLDGDTLYHRGFSDSAGTHMGVWPTADSLANAPAGWPTNMVRLRYEDENSNLIGLGDSAGDSVLAIPAVGDSVGVRMLFYYQDLDCSTDNFSTDHGFQNQIGTLYLYFHNVCDGAQHADSIEVGFGSNQTDPPNSYRDVVPINRPLRFEVMVGRPHADSVQILDARIIDDATNDTISRGVDFQNEWYGAGADTLSINRPTFFTASVNQAWTRWLFGASGQTGVSGNFCCTWFGGAAWASNDYPGPYAAGEGPG